SEARHELDLLVGEWADFLTINSEGTDQPVLFQHRDDEHGASARRFGERDRSRFTFEVAFLHSEIGNVLQLSGCSNAAKGILGGLTGSPARAAAAHPMLCGRRGL